MPAARGMRPPRAGKGRPKGRRNKITGDLKAMILGALSDVGGQRYLAEQAIANPKSFLALVGRILPMQLSGAGREPILLEQIASAAMEATEQPRARQRIIDVTPTAQLQTADHASGDSYR